MTRWLAGNWLNYVVDKQSGEQDMGSNNERWGKKAMLIGIDSATWHVMLPLIEQGRLPNIGRLMENGVSGPLRTFKPTLSPLIWATIITGKSPRKHGIRSFVVLKPVGLHRGFPELRPRQMSPWMRRLYRYGGLASFKRTLLRLGLLRRMPMSSNMRRCKALWNIFSERGRPVAVLNWWSSWPAEEVNGCVISQSVGHLIRNLRAASPRDTYPPELLQETAPFFPERGSVSAEEIGRFFEPSEADMEEIRSASFWDEEHPRPLAMLKFDYLTHKYFGRAATYCQARCQPDFMAILLSVDAVQHFFWHYMEPQHFKGVDARDVEKYGRVIERYYIYNDELVGDLLREADDETVVFIVSDHGHGPSGELPWSGRHDKGQDGVIIAAGPGIRKGQWVEGASVYDVAPTLLAAVGLPVARDFDGRARQEFFTQDCLAARPITSVDTYETENMGSSRVTPSEVDDEVVERLRGLGYFEGL